ncbi:MAG: NUDIX hydrolase [Legionellales bacterium]|nr:NUDIX hydrolase [Legionellales bacterium]
MSVNNKIKNALIDELLENISSDNIGKISVGAIINKMRNILFLKRRYDDFLGGFLDLPGGGVEKDEHIIDALIREVKEETGLDVLSINDYFGHFDYISGEDNKTRQFNFSVSVFDGSVQCNPEEHIDFFWLPEEKLQYFDISENTKNIAFNFYRSLT